MHPPRIQVAPNTANERDNQRNCLMYMNLTVIPTYYLYLKNSLPELLILISLDDLIFSSTLYVINFIALYLKGVISTPRDQRLKPEQIVIFFSKSIYQKAELDKVTE